ncbi:uncharacterized WD repeat-containing protein alr3466-like, partial [Nilaparvata lugens]|uniref:uncharacterized WD repeat-containing protein alr3466-like n=1 Tax=Nilaparvata lugens TaxID=108931 RepID=UPI00193D426D
YSLTKKQQTPFQSSLQPTMSPTVSVMLKNLGFICSNSGDSSRLKQLTMCNFDFCCAAVRTVSVSYLRSILEHVRCYLLDRGWSWSTTLCDDFVADSSGELMARLMLSAMAWCDGYTDPLLVPLTGWLQPPLPLQIKNVVVNGGVNLIEPTPSAQHIVVVPHTGDPQLWHVMSNTLVTTFKGHNGRVLCIAMTKQSQYLLTGGEDTSIIIWDLKTFELKLRIYEHIAPVLCLTPAMNNTLIASGGDDSRIIVTQLLPTGRRKAGDVVIKIDHHRGPVTNVLVTAASDILISGSSDGSVCLWTLDTFTVLNTITLPSPVCRLAISSDSVFLLAACEDNQLYLHTLATGTQIHCLRGHKAKVVSIWLAGDNQRAVAGGADGRVYVFDMHSGCLVRTISTSHNSKVTGVKVTNNDDFLITAGGNRITFWSFRKEDGVGIDELGVQMSGKPPNQAQRPHTASISCLDISRDGTTAVTGAMDSLINVWLVNTHELSATLEGHSANVTCLAISPNGLFVISGSEDKTARVWGLTLGLVVSVFT